ncbi:hypothetical protein Sru01_68300 [Sphaerisporangium rufum]|uniref:WD40 repeat domain-containing protein n=1 Tax=Sphaerisporangium rufum TaxID=1381558 RepID=A0A919R9U3_9ACTN|nr:hypothetical protein Sru01_68300 [Sphaerisporangium rufum]
MDFARRLRALQQATGLSVRRLEVESARTPRRRQQEALRLKRGTIAGMTSLERPVRPEIANFEVFIDTCLRVARENDIALPPELADRHAWDEAYRELREQVERNPRPPLPRSRTGPPPPAQPIPAEPVDPADPADPAEPVLPAEPVAPARPAMARVAGASLPGRRSLLAASALAAAAAGVGIPLWARRSGSPPAGSPATGPARPAGDDTYSPMGRLLSPPIRRNDPVWAVAIGGLRGEPLAVVGRGDGTVQLWNPVTGHARGGPIAGHDKPVYSIALQAPMAVSGSADGLLRVWNLAADRPTGIRLGDEITAGINGVALGVVDGRTVAVSAGDDHTVRIWDPAAPRRGGRILGRELDAQVKSVATGTLGGRPIAVSGGADGTVRLWDLAARRAVRLLGAHETTVGTVAVGGLPGRTVAVSGSEDGVVRLWDLSADGVAGTMLGDRIFNAVKTVAIGAVQGRTVAIAGADDGSIRIWDLATGRPYGAGLTGHATAAESLAIGRAAGRAIVVAGHWDGTIWTWSL